MTDVADDSHNLCPGIGRSDHPQAFVQRAPLRPEQSRNAFVHHGHQRGVLSVLLGKRSSLKDRNADGLEVIGRGCSTVNVQTDDGRVRTLEFHRPHLCNPSERKPVDHPG